MHRKKMFCTVQPWHPRAHCSSDCLHKSNLLSIPSWMWEGPQGLAFPEICCQLTVAREGDNHFFKVVQPLINCLYSSKCPPMLPTLLSSMGHTQGRSVKLGGDLGIRIFQREERRDGGEGCVKVTTIYYTIQILVNHRRIRNHGLLQIKD